MKRMRRTWLAVVLAGAVSLAPAVYAVSGTPVTVAYAHGHHSSGHHSSSSVHYYYCGGHEAHTHSGGVCPYADDPYYYCGGHEAHTHHNGVCPYASSVSRTTIKQVQKKLNRSGYNCGTADGVMGTKTKRAVKRFQRDNNLKADGVIGQQTLAALGLADL